MALKFNRRWRKLAKEIAAKKCAWCDAQAAQLRMLQEVCDNCAAAYDVHDQKWGH